MLFSFTTFSFWSYVIPIFRAILLRQGMKKARLPTQAPLWVNRRTMFYSQIVCEKAQKAPCFWHFMSLNVFSPIITASSTKITRRSSKRTASSPAGREQLLSRDRSALRPVYCAKGDIPGVAVSLRDNPVRTYSPRLPLFGEWVWLF